MKAIRMYTTEILICKHLPVLSLLSLPLVLQVDVPNVVHLFQTAERIREKFPDNRWFQLTGLVHDIGKLMALYGEPQVSLVDFIRGKCSTSL